MLIIAALLAATAVSAKQVAIPDMLATGTVTADLMTFGVEPALKPLFDKFQAALQNKPLMLELVSKSKPGEPLPYDARLGMTEDEYKRLGVGIKNMKLVPTGQHAAVTFTDAKDTVTIRSDACGPLKDGVTIDKAAALLTWGSHPVTKGKYFENRVTPLAPVDGFLFTVEGTHAQIGLMKRVEEKYCLVTCDVKGTTDTAFLRYTCNEKGSALAAAAPAPATPAPSTAGAPPPAPQGDDPLTSILGEAPPPPPAGSAATKPSPLPSPPVPEPKAETPPSPPPAPVAVEKKDLPKPATQSTAAAATSCRSSVSRYPYLSPSMLTLCKKANPFSAQAVDVYTATYKGGMPQTMLEALLTIDSQDKLDCSVQIARKFSGSMTVDYLKETCL